MWKIINLLFVLALGVLAVAEPVEFTSKQAGLSSTVSLYKNGSEIDLHMQIWGPKSAGWAGIGLGVMMEESLMFTIYPASNGKDVVVSPRTAKGHVMPKLEKNIKIEVKESTIDRLGTMMADFVCYGCTKWSTGKLHTSSTRQPFQYAMGHGKPMASDDLNAPISMHKVKGVFVGDLAKATVATSDADDQPLARPTLSNTTPSTRPSEQLVEAHAILLCLVFFGFLPTGAILLRLPFVKGAAFHVHWILQVWGFIVAIVGTGIAVNMSLNGTRWWDFTNYHQVIGIVIVALMLVQAIAGQWHHVRFVQIKRRTLVSYMHIGLGWAIVVMGMINGCLGFWITDMNDAAGGLGAAGGVILLAMGGVSVWNQLKRRQSRIVTSTGGVVLQDEPPSDASDNEESKGKEKEYMVVSIPTTLA